MIQQLANYFKASYPAIAIQTTEEIRAIGDVIEAAKLAKREVLTWSATDGLAVVGGRSVDDTEDLLAMCLQMNNNRRSKAIFILKDPHTWPFERDPKLARAFRDFIAGGPEKGCSVVILAPEFKPHPTVEKMCTILDYDLPSPDDLKRISDGVIESSKRKLPSASDDVIRALGGMNTTEAENALTLSLIENGTLDAKVIYREKVQAVKRTGLLELVDPDPRGMAAIGGLGALKEWIGMRRGVWSPRAVAYGLSPPKGVMLVGVQGCGKSLCAKAIGTTLGIPTLKLDIGSLLGSLISESETRTRDALKLADALAPCVLWADEIDKGLAGSSGSGSSDGGVIKRVFGTILTWSQERKKPVFFIATANDVSNIPPEFMRKGRFDEIFAVDLPNIVERQEILAIHLSKKGRDPKKFNLAKISESMTAFVGSEIEAVLDGAMFSAFSDSEREVTTKDLLDSASSVVPLSTMAKEQVDKVRDWARKRARFASFDVAEESSAPGRRAIGET